MSDGSAETDALVDIAWSAFTKHGRWPSRKEFLLRALDRGFSVDTVWRNPALTLRAGSGSEVRPSFDALVLRPDVRSLLAPLPAVLRRAADAFIAKAPLLDDLRSPELPLRDVKTLWPDASSAMRALAVLGDTGSGFLLASRSSATDPDDSWIHISIDYLRYAHAQDLDAVLAIRKEQRASDPGRYPSGRHLELLQRIEDFSKREQRWPDGLTLALGARDVGYVPQLVNDLRERFVRTEFRASRTAPVRLTLDALPFVDRSGEDRDLLMKAVQVVVSVWRKRADPVSLHVTELATAMGVPPGRVGPVVAFLESSRWCIVGHTEGDTHQHIVLTPGEPERVLRNESLRTFDEYMNAWDEETFAREWGLNLGALPVTDGRPSDSPSVPELPFGFIKRDEYSRVVAADVQELRQALDAKAWKCGLILIGGLIEGSLLDVLSRREDIAESVLRKKMSQASLPDLIGAAVKLKLVPETVVPFAGAAKDYRDLVHPFRAGASPLRPARESVRAMVHALELIVVDLDLAARDGRMSSFERM